MTERCDCNCDADCPLGRTGMMLRCTKEELAKAGFTLTREKINMTLLAQYEEKMTDGLKMREEKKYKERQKEKEAQKVKEEKEVDAACRYITQALHVMPDQVCEGQKRLLIIAAPFDSWEAAPIIKILQEEKLPYDVVESKSSIEIYLLLEKEKEKQRHEIDLRDFNVGYVNHAGTRPRRLSQLHVGNKFIFFPMDTTLSGLHTSYYLYIKLPLTNPGSVDYCCYQSCNGPVKEILEASRDTPVIEIKGA